MSELNEPALEPTWTPELALIVSARFGDDTRAVRDFAEFVFGLKLARHHLEWVDEVLANKRVVIVAPPESAKTTVISIILLSWYIGKYPWKTNLVVSAGEDMASDIAEKVADVIEFNPRYRLVFPNVQPDKKRGWSRAGYEVVDTGLDPVTWARLTATKKDPTIFSGGVGTSGVNGRRASGLCIGDDLHDRASRTSDKICRDTVDFVKDTFLSRATDDAHVVIVQTRWSRRDTVAFLKTLRDENGAQMYAVFEHPAIDADGNSYWPEQWPIERLNRRRVEVTEVVFKLVYLCDERAEEGTVLKADWLMTYSATQIKKEWPRFFGLDFTSTVREVTGGRNADPDHFALAVIVDTGGVLVVEDGFDGVLPIGEDEDVFFSMAAVFSPKVSAIEVNTRGLDYYKRLLQRMNAMRGVRYPLKPVRTTVGKIERLRSIAPFFQFGNFRISDRETPFLTEFRSQWIRFPGAKDDTLDAVYLGIDAAAYTVPQLRAATNRGAEQKRAPSVGRRIESAYG